MTVSREANLKLADELQRLCCAETEGKFFDLVTDSIDQILAALRQAAEDHRTSGERKAIIEECARELETSYPDHAWLNAACAAIRSLASSLPDHQSAASHPQED